MREKSTTFGDGVTITEAIIDTICKLQGIEREEFDYVLYDWIDPDALAKLLTNSPGSRRSVTVEFSISEFRITIRNDPAQDGRTITARKSVREATPAGLGTEGAQEI